METAKLIFDAIYIGITALLVVSLLVLARAIVKAKWVITIHVPASTTSQNQVQIPVVVSQEVPPPAPPEIVQKASKTEKSAEKAAPPAPPKKKHYPLCECGKEVKSAPVNSILSETQSTTVYKCKCGKEVKVIRDLEPPATTLE